MGRGWERRSRLPLIELRGRTALVIGVGGIGTQVAQRAVAFGMRVLAVDPVDVPLHRDLTYVGKPDELDVILPDADVVFSCVPRTPRTEGMLGKPQFDLMKDGAYVINVSRGAIIDTDALVAALRSGKLAGAGLDVTDPEPLPSDHPLWKMDNVIITPHVAGQSDRIGERWTRLFRDNIVRFVTGQPLRNVVDKQLGY
jgi:phosphoglycerate dehydrogenase-like enzyme